MEVRTLTSYVEIDLHKLRKNLQVIRNHVPGNIKIMAVVKNDAYGNGAVKVSQTALQEGFSSLGVARVSEGKVLRDAGITASIMILGLVPTSEMEEAIQKEFVIPVDSIDEVKALNVIAQEKQKIAQVMIAVDTGLHRIGIEPHSIASVIQEIKQYNCLNIVGIFTHFINPECKDKTLTNMQLQKFNDGLKQVHDLDKYIVSAADSAATEDVPDSWFNMVRVGCLLAGIQPSDEILHPIPVEPILSIKSHVVHVQKIKAGECVGYGATFKADKDMYIATVPVGYGDGYRRCLSDKASVLIHGKPRPIAGLVCMDQMMVVADESVHVGDEVVLVGNQGTEEIQAVTLARLCDANVHEFLGGFRRLEKVYKGE